MNQSKVTSKLNGATTQPSSILSKLYRSSTAHIPSSKNRLFSSAELDYVNNNNNNINNRFLYYNNETNKIEGVSLQSSYTTFKLNPYRNVNVITSTNQIFADLSNNNNYNHIHHNYPPEITSKYHVMTTRKIESNEKSADLFKSSQMVSLPLYHQFIYTIKFSNRVTFKNERDLVDLLNDQSVESSKIRVGLIRRVAEQLGINASTLRLNWVEKFSKPIVNNNNNNKTDDNSQEVSTSNELESVLSMDYYNENTLEEPEFISDDLSDLKAKIVKSKMNAQLKKGYFTLMISFSDIDLLDMQKSYFNLLKSSSTILNSHRARVNDLRNRFYLDCEEFFERIQEKHDYKFRLNVYNITKDQVVNKNDRFNRLEKLIKVQFLKLCDLNKLNKILVSFQHHSPNYNYNNKQSNLDLNSRLELTNQIIKNSTQEILFNTIKLEDEGEDDNKNNNNQTSQSKSAPRFSDEIILNTESQESESKIVKFKSETLSNETTINSNQNTNVTITSVQSDSFLNKYFNKKKLTEIFWSIIPKEDLVLAVIVPITIIVSMLILTIVVSCLLHMCNKNYRQRLKAKKLNNANTAINNTNLINNIASPSKSTKNKITISSSPQSPFTSNKSNPLYKQRPYLSKGVPVILYEEMSDKPIDDYDENNRNVIDSTGGSSTIGSSSHRGYYRSPLILRNEKPPMPAPPEYSRQSYDYLPNKSSPIRPLNDKLILNELHNILQKDIQSVLTDSPDESALLIESANKKTGINNYYKSSSSSQSSPPSATDDNLLLIGNGIKNHQSSTLKEVTKRLHDTINDNRYGVGEIGMVKNGNQFINNKPRHFQHNNLDKLIKP